VEKDLKALSDASASKEDISRVRTEVKKLYDGLHVGTCYCHNNSLIVITNTLSEFLDLRTYVWGIRAYTLTSDLKNRS
jgi:hypothetical protein